jgi:hypothetical protein
LPIRRNGIAPSSIGEAAMQIFSERSVETNLKRSSWHLLTFPLTQCDLSQCAQSCRKRKRKHSTTQIAASRCYHINSLTGNGVICKWELILPEHRPGTPAKYRCLESFLWHDFGAGRSDWEVWLRRKLPDIFPVGTAFVFRRAMQLHATLRSLQAANNGIEIGEELSSGNVTLNHLIGIYGIKPRLDEAGQISLATDKPADPVAILMLSVLDALQSGAWRRFKLCSESSCRASYFDASKAAAKTWCSMEICGSRNKMKRYRSKSPATG